MTNEGLGSWPARRARKTPERTALVYNDRASTFAEVDRAVRGVATGLQELGIGKGARVAFLGANSPAFVEVLFACGALGSIFVPVNTRLSALEIDYILRDSGADVVIVDEAFRDKLGSASPRLVIVNGPTGNDHFTELHDRIETAEAFALADVSLDDPCLILYTSGTTGRPKGAVLTHGNLTWNSINMVVDNDVVSDDVNLVVAPLFHVSALSNNLLPAFMKGAAVVLMAKFDAGEVLALVEKWGITYLHGVPTIYESLAAHPAFEETDLSSVKRAGCGGSPIGADTIATYQRRGIRFTQGYGMTETGPGVLYLSADRASDKLGAVGVPHFFVDCEVRDENGEPVGPGGRGEIVVRSRSVMREYWNNPAATRSAFDEDGFFRSGDVARIDDDGYLYIVDRIKDMVISGGENIYPSEIETIIGAHPDVLGCAVVGVPDDRWGEVCHLVVERRPGGEVTADELVDLVRMKLASFKVPKYVSFVEHLPRTSTGKIVKSRLRGERPRTPETSSGKANQ